MEVSLKTFITIVSLSSVLSGVVYEKPKTLSARIIGGQTSSDSEFPFQVSLRRYNNLTSSPSEHLCSGAILNKRWIVSSKNCILKNFPDTNDLLIGVGVDKFSQMPTFRHTEEIIFPEHKDENTHDISLIKTDIDIVFSSDTQPISLSQEYIGDKNEVILTGKESTSVSREIFIFSSSI